MSSIFSSPIFTASSRWNFLETLHTLRPLPESTLEELNEEFQKALDLEADTRSSNAEESQETKSNSFSPVFSETSTDESTTPLTLEATAIHEAMTLNEFSSSDLNLPAPQGPIITITEKVYIPVHQYPGYNFVGRIIGPRGMTAQQFEQETGCRLSLRGKGSMKKPRDVNHPSFQEELHVIIQCEDTLNRCRIKMEFAMEHIQRLLVPNLEGTDDLKRKQLMKLALLNGTYRPTIRV